MKNFCLILFIYFKVTVGKPYEGDKILRIFKPAPTTEDLENLWFTIENQFGKVELFGGRGREFDIFVKASVLEKVKSEFKKTGWKILPTSLDVQREVDKAENLNLIHNIHHRQKRQTTISNRIVGRYATIEEIENWLNELDRGFSNCKKIVIGKSVENRNISVLKISPPGDNKERPAIWLDSAIHAREWIAPASVIYITYSLLQDWLSGQKKFTNDVDWYVLPVVNPDGYSYSHTKERLWRKNRAVVNATSGCVGVDLNRNFGFNWATGHASLNPCSPLYVGPSAGSEPEVRAIQSFAKSVSKNLRAFISVHNYHQLWLNRWAYSSSEKQPFYNDTNALGEKAVKAMKNVWNVTYENGKAPDLLYAYGGGSPDWATGMLGVKYSYAIELRDKGKFGFLLPANYVMPVGEEFYAGIKEVALHIRDETKEYYSRLNSLVAKEEASGSNALSMYCYFIILIVRILLRLI